METKIAAIRVLISELNKRGIGITTRRPIGCEVNDFESLDFVFPGSTGTIEVRLILRTAYVPSTKKMKQVIHTEVIK